MSPFDFKRLKKWQKGSEGSNMKLEIPLPVSESGLALRWCPNEGCRPRRFQLGDGPEEPSRVEGSRVRRSPGTAGSTCPYCGTDGEDEEFLAPEDLEAALDQVRWAFEEDVGEWLGQMAKDFNRKMGRGGGLLGISMESSHRPRPAPRPWREDLLRVMECHICMRRYGVYAIAFFCPDCGSCNLANQFRREVALILAQIDVAEQVAESQSRELGYRLLGNAHEDVVTTFETYLKNSFRFAARERLTTEEWDDLTKKKMRGNPFQNLNRAEKLFAILGVDLFSEVSEDERFQLVMNFEKRHVVGHNLGIADEKFVDVSESDNIGETVALLAHDVEAFARLCLGVVERLEQDVPEFHPVAR